MSKLKIGTLRQIPSRKYARYIEIVHRQFMVPKRLFHQISGIRKTHVIIILVYLHNTLLQTSRGPLSDAPVRI